MGASDIPINSGRVGTDYFPRFSDQEYLNRWNLVQEEMDRRGLDCLLIYGFSHYSGNDIGQPNVVWLSGFANCVHSYIVFPRVGTPTLCLTLDLHIGIAKRVSPMTDIRSDYDLFKSAATRMKELNLANKKLGIVGFAQGTNSLPMENYTILRRDFPTTQLEDVTAWFEELRLYKSDEETALMEEAGQLTDEVYDIIVKSTQAGMKRSHLCRLIGKEVSARGGSWCLSHVASQSMMDPIDYYTDFYATDETIEMGHICQTEIAIGYGHYFTKVTGSYFMGEPTEDYRRLFDSAVECMNRCIEGLKPGMTGKDVNQFMEPARKYGFEQGVLPLVWGWGIYNTTPLTGATEGTRLAQTWSTYGMDSWVFKPGLSVTVIAMPVIPGSKKGLWTGQTCIMTDDGLKRLSKYPVDNLVVIE